MPCSHLPFTPLARRQPSLFSLTFLLFHSFRHLVHTPSFVFRFELFLPRGSFWRFLLGTNTQLFSRPPFPSLPFLFGPGCGCGCCCVPLRHLPPAQAATAVWEELPLTKSGRPQSSIPLRDLDGLFASPFQTRFLAPLINTGACEQLLTYIFCACYRILEPHRV